MHQCMKTALIPTLNIFGVFVSSLLNSFIFVIIYYYARAVYNIYYANALHVQLTVYLYFVLGE